MPATSVACLSSDNSPHGAQARSTSSSHSNGMSGSASRSRARRSVARTRSTTLRSSGRSLSAPPEIGGCCCGATELRPSSTIDHGSSVVSLRATAPRLYGVASAITADQTRWRAAAARWPLAGPSTVPSSARNSAIDGLAGPHVAPTAVELSRQRGDDIRAGHVLVQHLDRGAVPALVNVAQHRRRRLVIVRRRWAFRHRELEAHREVEFLGVAGANPLPAPLEFECLEPCCGGTQFGSTTDDQVAHRRGRVGGDHRGRILRGWIATAAPAGR